MAPHSSTLAWKIPWMEEPGRLQSMGSLRVRHDWAASLLVFDIHKPEIDYFGFLMYDLFCFFLFLSCSSSALNMYYESACQAWTISLVNIFQSFISTQEKTVGHTMMHTFNMRIGEDSGDGKDWGQEKKQATDNEIWMASSTQWTWVWANSGR